MKAVLHENPMERYETVFEGRKKIEVSGEMVVPDKMPDIGLLGDASAHVLLRSKRVESGCAIIEGELSASIFYIPDGGCGYHVIRMQLPWGTEFEGEGINNGEPYICDVRMVHLETRMLNPRKILLKATLEGTVKLFAYKKDAVCDSVAENDVIQVKKNSVECSVISTVCEKTFVATDEYPLPPDMSGGEVIGKTVQFRVEDIKTLTNKLIIKGSVLSDVVVASDEGRCERLSFTSAFSFIVETDCERVSDNVFMNIIPTAMYYETASGGRVLSVEVHGVCQMTVYENRTITYLADAFSNFHPNSCEWEKMNVYQNVKRAVHRETMTNSIVCRSRVECIRFLSARCTVLEMNGKSQINALVGACVQYENGSVDWLSKQLTLPLTLKEETSLWEVRVNDLYGNCNGTEVEFRVTLDWESAELTPLSLEYITAVSWEEEQCLEQRKVSFTVVQKGGDLWELARKYGSTVHLIQTYNELDEENMVGDGMLLIPTQRK